MTIRIPIPLVIAGGVLMTALAIGMLVQQAPEITRYLKSEGM
jgi:hypothetical protein